jgi:hypothetical protein
MRPRDITKWLEAEAKWIGVVLGILSCGFSAFTLWHSDQRADQSDRRADQHDAQVKQSTEVSAYVASTTRFDNAAQAYAGMILSSGTVDAKSKEELLASLVDQRHTIERVAWVLPADEQPAAQSYSAALGNLSDAVQGVTGVEDMKPYWSNLSNVLVLRRELDGDFQKVDQKS